ncbi:MAG: glycosyltransferase family 4 protein [Syntrophotaleaceae bacterium]
MKIALVNKVFSLSHGGLERFSVNLAVTLQGAGHEVHVFGQSFSGLPEGIVLHLLPDTGKSFLGGLLKFHRLASRAIGKGRFDIVLGLTRFYPMDVYRMGDGLQRHWMRICYPFLPWRWFNYLVNTAHAANLYLERKILSGGVRRIITNSRLCKEQVCKYYKFPEENVEVVYNGVDHSLFHSDARPAWRSTIRKELGLGAEDIALLHVSNNWQRKGLETTLKAMAAMGQSGERMHLIVAGRGKVEIFRRLAGHLGLEKRIHFIGSCTQMERYYAAGDLLVLPTLYDPFSNVCLEAMACGLPVVTTAANGASEILVEGETGYVQKDPKDMQELAQILEKCLDSTALLRMGEAARRDSEAFTLGRNMQQILEVFEKVVAEKTRFSR